jgi:peptidoglycan hydrolase CwlO-like protein
MTVLRKFIYRAAAITMSLLLVYALGPSSSAIISSGLQTSSGIQSAYADDDLDALESKVKQSAAAYNSAVSRTQELKNEISELNEKIAKLEKKLPAQKKRSNRSYRALYKYQYDTSSVVMMLLNSSSLTEMLATLDSYNRIIEYNTSEIKKTIKMENEYKESKSKLESDKQEAEQQQSNAYSALQEAKQARKEAQQRAIQKQKEEAAAQKAAAQAKLKAAKTKEEKASAKKEVKAAEEEESSSKSSTSSSASNVGWSSSKTAFVNKWAPRINAYLSGSPTAGTGKYYAAAAWDNGVDPRWAPAISCVESSKGAACFASYNAWGYGSSRFSSWEDGINTVVGALGSSMYGGYLTRAAAATYCTSNPSSWYSNCKAEMAKI